MRVGSLFSGIGGFDLGLERAGMEVVWQVEIDEYCQKVLAKHWPNVVRYGDIKQIRGEELGAVDILVGGPPCQPFSAAGRREGKADDRHLWPEMHRIIRAIMPRWVIVENVAGLVGMVLDDIIVDLEAEGYETRTFVLPACSVGATHRRDRVWVVAHANSQRQPQSQGSIGQERRWNSDGNQDVGNAIVQRCGGVEWGRTAHQLEDRCEELADTNGEGLANGKPARIRQDVAEVFRNVAQPQSQRQGDTGRATESSVGGADDGLPSRLDRPWPAPLGCDQYEWEEPRQLRGSKGRIARLKALGNAVVPQVVEVLGRAIMEVERSGADHSAD